MKNELLITILLLATIMLATSCVSNRVKLSKAKAYIEALEKDFPDYIDVTSGTDAYDEYYRLVK